MTVIADNSRVLAAFQDEVEKNGFGFVGDLWQQRVNDLPILSSSTDWTPGELVEFTDGRIGEFVMLRPTGALVRVDGHIVLVEEVDE